MCVRCAAQDEENTASKMETGRAIMELPKLAKMSPHEIEDLIAYCETERALQEEILRGAKQDEDVADLLARIKELGRWKDEARKELAKRPVEQQPRRLLSLEELEAEAATEIEWLIPGLWLPVGGSCLIAGPPGIGKSWLAQHAAISVASGDRFLRHYPTKKGPVVYIDEESSAVAFKVRLVKLRNGHGPYPEPLPLSIGMKQAFLLDHGGVLKELIGLLRAEQPVLVVLDALIRLHQGDENSARDMGRVTKALSAIEREVGCAVMLIQHERKEGLFKNRRDVVRGSSELTAWPDSVITLKRNGNQHEAYVLKSRSSADGQVIIYRQLIDDDVAVLEFIREEEADAPQAEKAKRVVAELFANDRVWTRQELFAATKPMGFGEKVTIAALSSLEDDDDLIKSWRAGIGGAFHYQRVDAVAEQEKLSCSEA